MAYEKGMARVEDSPMDSRADFEDYPGKAILLPHACEEWVIGGKDEVEQLILDLQRLVRLL